MFSDFQEHVIGVPQIAPQVTNNAFEWTRANEDFGKEQMTGDPHDRYNFRTSPLRNVAVQAAFMHNGAFTEALGCHPPPSRCDRLCAPLHTSQPAACGRSQWADRADRACALAHGRSILATPIALTGEEFDQLVAFVRNGLLIHERNPENLRRLVPRAVPSGRPVLTFEFP